MSTAEFTIDGDPYANLGYDATDGQVLTLQAAPTPGTDVYKVKFSVLRKSKGAPDPVFSPSSGEPTTVGGTVDLTLPSGGIHSYLLQCQFNNGVNSDAAVVADWTKRRLVALRAASGPRKMVPGERTEYETPDGWTGAFNDLVDLFVSESILAFGADPTLDDNAEAIQAAIDAAEPGVLEIPLGIFKFKSQLLIKDKSLVLRGKTQGSPIATPATVLRYDGPATTEPVLLFQRTPGTYEGTHQGMESLRVDTNEEDAVGVRFDAPLNAHLRDVDVYGFQAAGYYGLDLGSRTALTNFDKAWQIDVSGPSYVDETTDTNDAGAADVDPWPTGAGEATGDQYALGYREKFDLVTFILSTLGVGGTATVKYWNGSAWTAVTGLVSTPSGVSNLTAAGTIFYDMPEDWAKRTINGSPSLYYLVIEVATTYATNPVITQVQHQWFATEALDCDMDNVQVQNCEFGLYIRGNQIRLSGVKPNQNLKTQCWFDHCQGLDWRGVLIQGAGDPAYPACRMTLCECCVISGGYLEIADASAAFRLESGCSCCSIEHIRLGIVNEPKINFDLEGSNWLTLWGNRHFGGANPATRAIKITGCNAVIVANDTAAGVFSLYPTSIEVSVDSGVTWLGGTYDTGDTRKGQQIISGVGVYPTVEDGSLQRLGDVRPDAALANIEIPDFDALAVPSCVLWVRGDRGLTTDPANVSAALDFSGAAHHASQATAGNRPPYDASYAPLGNQGIIEAQNGDQLDIAGSETAGDWTFFAVYDYDSTSAAAYILFDSAALIIAPVTNTSGQIGYFDGAWQSVAAAVTGPQLVTWRLEQGINEGRVYRNGVSIGTGTYGTARGIVAPAGILGGHTSQTLRLGAGVAYKRALAAAERSWIEKRLMAKFGLP